MINEIGDFLVGGSQTQQVQADNVSCTCLCTCTCHNDPDKILVAGLVLSYGEATGVANNVLYGQ
jgi:hypothetical protein